jgi:hypothetical protein
MIEYEWFKIKAKINFFTKFIFFGTTVITHKKNFMTHSPIFITQIPL